MDLSQSLWVEKHRPTKLSEVVLPDDYRNFFETCISKNEISNFLFVGPPGGGKSTLARILTSKHGVLSKSRDNLLEVNGSAKETRGIGYVSDVIEPFLKVPPAGKDKYKIVFIDECDHLTDQSFHSQRAVIEKYSKHYGRFIYTANYISQIPDAVQSRFQIFTFRQIPSEFVKEYCYKILECENVTYDPSDVAFVVSELYPDVRKIVNALQRNVIKDKLTINKDVSLNNEKVVVTTVVEIALAVKNRENSKISSLIEKLIKLLDEVNFEYRSVYTSLFQRKELPVPLKIIVNKYANSHNSCLVASMHFFAMIYEMIKCIQDYGK